MNDEVNTTYQNRLTFNQKVIKRVFDFIFSFSGILIVGWFIILLIFLASVDTKKFGLFVQKRVGYRGKLFNIYKIRTYKEEKGNLKTTFFGKFLRNTKLDELPQLFNVLLGNMSFVGPRPDVVGFADELKGENRLILLVKPGITGPATLYFKNEEIVLESQKNPDKYNEQVIWPKKVELNLNYVKNYSFKRDLRYILKTIGLVG
ncbi:sugar transferase [Lutibacter sp. B1]|uniref:sugar transferase n=1 Tax=Lutibacter sp. B1 TaxID=2725996 RepID=UPI00145721AB|nr:sugar transferase [Lutibacter sp. B1]NLP58836.1 sugar transferase [Lutibacter sp. B1]